LGVPAVIHRRGVPCWACSVLLELFAVVSVLVDSVRTRAPARCISHCGV